MSLDVVTQSLTDLLTSPEAKTQANLIKLQNLKSKTQSSLQVDFTRYASDPVGFGTSELGEDYTNEIKVMMESVRDNEVTIATSANKVGKTHAAARVALWFYKSYERAQVYATAAPPERNLKKLLWGEIESMLLKHPHIFADDTATMLNIQRSPLEFMTGVSIPTSGRKAQREAKFSGKSSPHILFIVDEGDAVPDEIYKAIESSMSGGHARLLIMYNPREKRGEVYRRERDGLANVIHLSAFDHPNVKTGKNVIPGAVTRNATVRRINQWSRPLMESEARDADAYEVPDFLVGTTAIDQRGQEFPPLVGGWRKVTDPALFYMTLGVYPTADSYQLISDTLVAAARSRWDLYVSTHGEIPPEGVRPLMGLDVAEYGHDANCETFRYGGWVARFKRWNGLDTDLTATQAGIHYKECNASWAAVDAIGVGANVAPKMKRNGCNAVAVKVSESPTRKVAQGQFRKMRDQLWWSCREWLEGNDAMLPPDELLIEELTIPTYRNVGGKLVVMSKEEMRDRLNRSPDAADSLCLTFAPRRSGGGIHV